MRPAKFPKSTRLNSLSHSFVHILVGIGILALSPLLCALGQATSPKPASVLSVSNPCPRPPVASAVQQRPDLFSVSGVLKLSFSYQLTTRSNGNLLHLSMTDRMEETTLEVDPGDTLNITVNNNTPQQPLRETFNPSNCEDITVQFSPSLGSIQTAKKNHLSAKSYSLGCMRPESKKYAGPVRMSPQKSCIR